MSAPPVVRSAAVLLRDATSVLAAAGVASPRADAEQLAAHVLGIARGQLVTTGDVEAAAVARLRELVDRRAAREPLQHLVGSAGFRHLELLVGPGVFVPRPETEIVVEWALAAVAGIAAPVVVDLCTGSGACALAIAQEHPGAAVHAVEVDPVAFGWAARNVAATGLPVTLHRGAAGPGLLPALAGRVDLVVSNPPYLTAAEVAAAEPEVRDHDPRGALTAGPDPLAVVRDVERAARRLLRPGGGVVVEHSDTQGAAVPAVFATGPAAGAAWTGVTDHRDLAGRDRFVTARRIPDLENQ